MFPGEVVRFPTIPGLKVYLSNRPLITIGGIQSRSNFQYTLQAPNIAELYRVAPEFERLVRALPELAALRKGGHVRHMASEPGFGCVARSFAAIYVLILVFEGPFDELLTKRAVAQALPTIERLVAARAILRDAALVRFELGSCKRSNPVSTGSTGHGFRTGRARVPGQRRAAST